MIIHTKQVGNLQPLDLAYPGEGCKAIPILWTCSRQTGAHDKITTICYLDQRDHISYADYPAEAKVDVLLNGEPHPFFTALAALLIQSVDHLYGLPADLQQFTLKDGCLIISDYQFIYDLDAHGHAHLCGIVHPFDNEEAEVVA